MVNQSLSKEVHQVRTTTYQQQADAKLVGLLFRLMPLSLFWIVLPALAQDSPGRFEIGGAFSSVHTSVIAGTALSASLGLGLEGDLNIGRHLALDAAVYWLPSERLRGQSVMGLFGAKAGMRTRRFGFFAKVRPGFITVDNALRQITVIDESNAVVFANKFDRLTERILDVGGVAEYYPAHRWTLRYDLGDTLMFEEPVIVTGVPTVGAPVSITNHLQFSASVHYRF